MSAQVNGEKKRHVLFEEIIDHRIDVPEMKQQYAFITTQNGNKLRRETTKGWEIIVQWKDRRSYWISLEGMKKS